MMTKPLMIESSLIDAAKKNLLIRLNLTARAKVEMKAYAGMLTFAGNFVDLFSREASLTQAISNSNRDVPNPFERIVLNVPNDVETATDEPVRIIASISDSRS